MDFDREAAKAEGYTDEEIDAYLASKGQPLPEDQPIDRTEEYKGVASAAIPEAAKIGLELGAAGLAYKGLKNIVRGPVAPGSVPPTPPGATQSTLQSLVGRPGSVSVPSAGPAPNPNAVFAGQGTGPAPVAQQAEQGMVQRGMQYADKVRQIAMEKVLQGAQKAAPIAQAARPVAPAALGIGGMLYSGGLNQGEEEELRRRRMMPPTIR